MRNSDSATFDLSQARLQLKDGLRFVLQPGKHEDYYLVEDELSGNFFRLGIVEYAFLSMLDGKTPLGLAIARTCSKLGKHAMSEQQAVTFSSWLVETGLAKTQASLAASKVRHQQNRETKQKLISRLNPISIRITLWNPDRFVSLLENLLRPLLNWPVAFACLLICLYAATLLASEWTKFVSSSVQCMSRDSYFWLIASWLLLKTIHELGHALACKRFKGRVNRFGIVLLLFIPLPFVDVTSAWRFTNKWHRILTSAAGMLVELVVAALAIIVWVNTDPGLINTLANNLIIAASLHTLLFNANPLMRFDGYHILADWLEIPNLGQHGSNHVKHLSKRFLFGIPTTGHDFAGVNGLIVKVYGIAAFLWKILICAGLALAAANLMPGFGLVLAIIATFVWVVMPGWKVAQSTLFSRKFEAKSKRRFVGVVGFSVAGVLLVGKLPAPTVVRAPFVIEYGNLRAIRAESAGFVDEIRVRRDEEIQRGSPLIVLRNPQLELEADRLTTELNQAQLRARLFKNRGEVARWQIEQESIDDLSQRLRELDSQREQLTLRAPFDGRVVADNLAALQDRYVETGDSLLSIAANGPNEAIALVSQKDSAFIQNALGLPVQLVVWGGDNVVGKLSQVAPKSQDLVPHFAFAGAYGGPLEVIDRGQVDSKPTSDAKLEQDQSLKLVKSRIPVVVELERAFVDLRPGQTGTMLFRNRSQSMGQFAWERASDWFVNRVYHTHGL